MKSGFLAKKNVAGLRTMLNPKWGRGFAGENLSQAYNPQNHTMLSAITVLENLQHETNSFVIRDKKNESLV